MLDNNYIGNLSENRLAHVNSVAKYMYDKAVGDECYKSVQELGFTERAFMIDKKGKKLSYMEYIRKI